MKKLVEVTRVIEVEVDETKFTPQFMEEFRDSFYPFMSIDDHLKHLAQLEARGLLDSRFIEGYGAAKDMGIKTRVVDQEEEIVES